MPRILFVSSVYPRSYDPTRGAYCYATCKALVQQGHEVRVVSPRSWIECLRKPEPADERQVREVGPTEFPCFYYPPGVLQNTYGWWMWHSVKRPLLRVAREFQPEAILSYWADPDGTTAVSLGRCMHVPVGIIVGGSDILLLTQNIRRRKVITRTLQAANGVLAVSQDLREKAIALGVSPATVHVSYQGVDESFCPGDRNTARQKLGLPQDREILLWVGRMAPVKGLEVLIEGLAQVVTERPGVLLLLVGDGPERGKVASDVQRCGLADNVQFVGSMLPENLPDWYRSANVTVLSSHSEGIPNVLRESLACGTPYVATNVGGISELCDHPAVRLVPPRDSRSLARAVCDALGTRVAIPDDIVERGWSRRADQLIECLLPQRVDEPTCVA